MGQYMRNYIRYVFYLIVFIGFSLAYAGSYSDFFDAIESDDASTLSRLIERGFDVNTLGPTGMHGLLSAIRTPSPKSIAVLLKAPGIVVEVRNDKDESALMLAALAGMQSVCERLVAMDADVNKTGWTPLHYAAISGNPDVVRLLLDHYAYIDAESPNQTTPLMMAAMYGSFASVQMLLDAGADVSLRNALGLSALDFADRAQRADVHDLIEKQLQKAGSARAPAPPSRWLHN